MSWHLGRLCGFDLETTGVDVENDRIVTACVVLCGGKHPTQSTTWLANPGMEIPEAASAVHGITNEKAQTEGQPAGQVGQQVVQALAQAFNAGIPIVAMNAPFDLTMLDREARRHHVFPLADSIDGILRVIDPRILDKHVDTYRSGKRRLTDLCAHYGVPLEGAHSAGADALAACRVLKRLGSRYPKPAELDVDAMHKAQIEWAAEQAASFQAHLRSKGETDAVIDGSWRMRQVGGAA